MIDREKLPSETPTKPERDAWERRACMSGCRYTGVLPKGFPESLNEALHRYHTRIVLEGLGKVESGQVILDAGCGFGRISAEIRKCHPLARLAALDGASDFIRNLKQYVPGQVAATAGDILDMPFGSNCFDAVIIVTCLMYIPKHLRRAAMKEVFRVTKKHGRIIVVEPGLISQQIYSCFGLLGILRQGKGKTGMETGGTAFVLKDLFAYAEENHGRVIRVFGNVGFTFLLLPLFISAKYSSTFFLDILLRLAKIIDRFFTKLHGFSMHVGIVIQKGSND